MLANDVAAPAGVKQEPNDKEKSKKTAEKSEMLETERVTVKITLIAFRMHNTISFL